MKKLLVFILAYSLALSPAFAIRGGIFISNNSPLTIAKVFTSVGTDAAPSHSFTNGTGYGMRYDTGGGALRFSVNGTARFALGATSADFITDRFSFGATNTIFMFSEDANTLAQRNGVNAQAFRLYNTYTDAANYERLEIGANVAGIGANTFGIATTAVGTGLARDLYLRASSRLLFATNGPNNRWLMDTAGHFLASTDNTYDIGASGANRPRNIYAAGALTSTSLSATGDYIKISTAKTPASSAEACTAGTITWDTNYTYVCVAANTWKRSALAAF